MGWLRAKINKSLGCLTCRQEEFSILLSRLSAHKENEFSAQLSSKLFFTGIKYIGIVFKLNRLFDGICLILVIHSMELVLN